MGFFKWLRGLVGRNKAAAPEPQNDQSKPAGGGFFMFPPTMPAQEPPPVTFVELEARRLRQQQVRQPAKASGPSARQVSPPAKQAVRPSAATARRRPSSAADDDVTGNDFLLGLNTGVAMPSSSGTSGAALHHAVHSSSGNDTGHGHTSSCSSGSTHHSSHSSVPDYSPSPDTGGGSSSDCGI